MNESFPNDYVDLDDVEITYNTTYGAGDPVPVEVNARGVHNAGNRGRDSCSLNGRAAGTFRYLKENGATTQIHGPSAFIETENRIRAEARNG